MSHATPEQIERIKDEAWDYKEVAIRARTDPATAFRWRQKGWQSMPWATAALLVAQADGRVGLAEDVRKQLYALRARPARRALTNTTKEVADDFE